MTSRNLFFKLLKEDFKRRIWAAALVCLGCFFLFPVSAQFMAGLPEAYVEYGSAFSTYSKHMRELLCFGNYMTAFSICIAALICGLSSFSYLNSRSKVDFYHSIPVRRELLYAVNYLDGILITAIPYAVAVFLAAMIGIMNGVRANDLISVAVKGYFLNMNYFLLLYAAVVLAAMLTGNVIIGFLGTLVFAFYMPISAMVIEGYVISFFSTYYNPPYGDSIFGKLQIHGSPLMEYLNQMANYKREPVTGAAAAFIVFLILSAAGCFLYRKRPSEAAGKAMAFSASKPIIRILICLSSALGLGLMFWSMREATGWAVFGIVCGAVISHCVIEIIYHFDFKKLFSHKLQLVGCVAAAIAVLCVFRFDLAGYDRYLPQAAAIENVQIEVSPLNRWTSYGTTQKTGNGYYVWEDPEKQDPVMAQMQCTDTATVLELASEGICQTAEEKEKRFQNHNGAQEAYTTTIGGADGPTVVFAAGKYDKESEAAELWGGSSDVLVCYSLKNGHKVYRTYRMLLKDVVPQLNRLWSNPEYLQATFPVMTKTGADVSVIRYREMDLEKKLEELTEKEREELLKTYQKEFAALTMETMHEEYPVGLIQFADPQLDEAISWWENYERTKKQSGAYIEEFGYYGGREDLAVRDYYPVYPSFTETIRLLKQYGLNPGDGMKTMDLVSAEIYYYSDDYAEKTVVVRNPEQLEELKQLLVDGNRHYYDVLYDTESKFNVDLRYENENGENMRSALFPIGEVPEFIWEEFQKKN